MKGMPAVWVYQHPALSLTALRAADPASVKVAERVVVAAVFSVLSEELSCSVDAGPVIAKNIRKDMGAITSSKEGEERKSAGTKERVIHVDRVQVCHQVAAVRNRGRT